MQANYIHVHVHVPPFFFILTKLAIDLDTEARLTENKVATLTWSIYVAAILQAKVADLLRTYLDGRC